MAFKNKSLSDETEVKIYGAELTMRGICEDIEKLHDEIRELNSIVNQVQMKASLSSCLLVVRKTSEENYAKIRELID